MQFIRTSHWSVDAVHMSQFGHFWADGEEDYAGGRPMIENPIPADIMQA